MSSFFGRVVILALTFILIVVSISFTMVILQTNREYAHLKERQRQIESELAELRLQREQREAYLRLVLGDPEFLERVVRDRLGLVKPDETVFRFDARR